MKAKTISKLIFLITLVVIIASGIKNSTEVNSVSFIEKDAKSVKALAELIDEMNLANIKVSYHFKKEKKITAFEKAPQKISFSVNSEIRAGKSGQIEADAYILEDLILELVEYGQMRQNRFSYKVGSEEAKGIIYKIDANHYTVSLEDGSHVGTRMKLKNTVTADEQYEAAVQSIVDASIAANS